MKFLLAVGAGFVAFLLSRGIGTGTSRLPLLGPEAVGIVVGDSLTAHDGYRRALAGLTPYRSWDNVSEVGAGAGRILELLREANVEMGPGDAVVLAGVNDIASGRSLGTIQARLLDIYSHLKSFGYRVIVVTTLPWAGYTSWTAEKGQKQQALNAWLKEQARLGVVDCVVDAFPAFSNQGRLRSEYDQGDGIHLNQAGQVALGRLIARQAYGLALDYPTK